MGRIVYCLLVHLLMISVHYQGLVVFRSSPLVEIRKNNNDVPPLLPH